MPVCVLIFPLACGSSKAAPLSSECSDQLLVIQRAHIEHGSVHTDHQDQSAHGMSFGSPFGAKARLCIPV